MTDAPLDPADRLFWEIADRFPTRPMVCALYLELAGPPDRPRLERRIAALAAAHPRLAADLVVDRGGPRWRGGAAPTPTWTIDSAADHAERLARLAPRLGDPLPPGPAWSLEVLADRGPEGADATVHGLVLRWHHALTDAEGMIDLLGVLSDAEADRDLDFERDHLALDRERPEGERSESDRDLVDPTKIDPRIVLDRKPTIADAPAPGLVDRLRQFSRRLRGGPRPGADVGGARVDYREVERRLDARDLDALARDLGLTRHDFVVAVVARALRRLDLEGGAPTIVHSPISARPRDDRLRLGNFGHPLHVVVDGDPADLEASLRAIGAANAAAIARAAAPPAALLRLLPRLPRRALERALARTPRFVANYLPWSDAPRSVAGALITALHGFAPLLPFRGCTVAAIGYRRGVRLVLATDPTIHSDADADAIHGALSAEVLALADLAARRAAAR
ncbi:MAG: hypothetical protein R3B09_26965 [Nannocystaceae bacterium]